MANHVSELEKWYLSQLRRVPEVLQAVGDRIFNSVAGQKARKPYHIFNIVPLKNTQGQKGSRIMSRFLVDSIFYAELPLDANVDEAIEALNAHFASSHLDRATDDVIISIWQDRPINQRDKGATANEFILKRGTTYNVQVADL